MLITVAICTYNRAESLRRTLASLATMRVPEGLDWEVVVVTNNCTDNTDAVIASFTDRLLLRRERERQQGQSHARNRAVDVANGDYILWTDDDVVVDRDWLAAYAAAFCRWPEAAVFGGAIRPKYEEPTAKWLADSEAVLGGLLVIRDFGDKPLPLSITEDRLPFGANFAVRTAEQRAFRYDPALGLCGDGQRRGDEIDVVERLLCTGATGYWVPAARVEHCIPRERQTIRYVTQYFAGWGETGAVQSGCPAGPFLFGAPRWLWRRWGTEWLRYQVHRWISPAPVWVAHLKAYSTAGGAISYWRTQRR